MYLLNCRPVSIKKGILFLLALCSTFLSVKSQPTNYLRDYIKVWGFIKYYHPSFASGELDVDSFFIGHLPELRKMSHVREYRNLWAKIGGQLKTDLSSFPADTADLFLRNLKLDWIDHDRLLPKGFRKQLQVLRRQGYNKETHIYLPEKFFSTEIPAEKTYDSIAFPDPDYQLLALARYWNAIEYLFAYKYMISGKWDDVLTEQIPAFSRPMTTVDLERHLLALNAGIEDTHGGGLSIRKSAEIYGRYFPPFTFALAGDSLVVMDYIDSLSCMEQNVYKGDIIVRVRGKSVQDAMAGYDGYVSASNTHKRRSMLSAIPMLFPFRGADSVISISILRKGVVRERPLLLQQLVNKEFVSRINQLYLKQSGGGNSTLNSFVLKPVGKDVVQVDAANLSILYNSSNDDVAIDSVMTAMLQYRKAIILDLRCYATQAVFYNKFLSALGWRLAPFARLLAPYKRFPGSFYEEDIFSPVQQPAPGPLYPGQVILLVNERTQSQSELITMILQASGQATVVGTQTAGCDGDLIYMPVPGGYVLTFSGRHVDYPDGTASQKLGVKRDVPVSYTTRGLAEGRDEILEAALRLVN